MGMAVSGHLAPPPSAITSHEPAAAAAGCSSCFICTGVTGANCCGPLDLLQGSEIIPHVTSQSVDNPCCWDSAVIAGVFAVVVVSVVQVFHIRHAAVA